MPLSPFLEPLLGSELSTFEVCVDPKEVVFVKGVFEASEGVGAIFADRGGELTVACPKDRTAETAALLADLELEVGAVVRRLR